MSLARDMNTYIQAPEIAIVGAANHMKTQLIEAFLGYQLVDASKGWVTKRPIHIKLISAADAATPRITFKRDYSSKNFNTDQRVDFKDFPAELAKRNTASQVPLVVEWESKDCWNITIIETPDLYLGGAEVPKGVEAEKIQEDVLELVRPPHRVIVGFEESCDWGKSLILDLAKQADPRLDRTVFVYNKLQRQIKNYTETKDVNQYFSSTLQGHNDKAYFVDLLETSDRSDAGDSAKFRNRLFDLSAQTVEVLENLKFDRRSEAYIGVHAVRKHLWDATWKTYQDNIPTVSNRLRALKTSSEQSLFQLQGRLNGMDIFKLRSAASNFVMNFLQSVEKLIVGTLDGNPAQNGQTLAEEKKEAGEWYDNNGEPIQVNYRDWNIPYAETRIYGGQQFERLLAEFRAVADHIEMGEIPVDDVATAAGPTKLNNVNSIAWAASDLARRQAIKCFQPLLDHLVKRSVLIMNRLPEIATKMMANIKAKSRAQAGGAGVVRVGMGMGLGGSGRSAQAQEFDIGVDDFPFFTHHVKDLYNVFITTIAEECRDKCNDEFYCTRLIYWENKNVLPAQKGSKANEKASDFSSVQAVTEIRDTVASLAANIFRNIKERVTRNVLLKCHNYFIVPMQSPLWGEIQSKVSVLSNQMLEEVFEVTTTTARLKEEEKQLQHILDKFGQQETLFQQASHAFSHPVRT